MRTKALKFSLTAILLSCGIAVFSQTEEPSVIYKNEIGIDVANVLTFLSKKNESYLINYKHHLTDKHSLRGGLNLDWSTSKDGYKVIKFKAGYERNYPVFDRWKLHWGVDASLRYQANNFQPNKSIRYGVSPLIGFSFFLAKRFTISTEMSVNFLYTDLQNPASFDPTDNQNVWDINIGSVGMVVISYHFN